MQKYVYLIHIPGDNIAGGTESLFQLGAAINENGGDANICYFPYEYNFMTPEKFKDYNVSQKRFFDTENTVHVFPENRTKLSKKIKRGKCCIFWLSVDNYYYKKDHYGYLKRLVKFYGSLLKTRLPFSLMKNHIHLLQSEFSRQHLAKTKWNKIFIGDYIKYDNTSFNTEGKKNKILYNPVKGFHITKNLINNNPDLEFVALAGYSRQELEKLMAESAVYIDFGNHPGRDRLPREFVLKGGVVITGKRGSAENDIDIPIPSKYKLNTESAHFYEQFRILVDEVFKDITVGQTDMKSYRDIIVSDPETHSKNVKEFLSFIDTL